MIELITPYKNIPLTELEHKINDIITGLNSNKYTVTHDEDDIIIFITKTIDFEDMLEFIKYASIVQNYLENIVDDKIEAFTVVIEDSTYKITGSFYENKDATFYVQGE